MIVIKIIFTQIPVNLKTKDINEIAEVLKKSSVITLITHQNPDGDAIGSVLGLYHYLLSLGGKKVNVIVPDDYPDFLAWMPGCDKIIIACNEMEKVKKVIQESEAIFCLDFNHTSRIAIIREQVLKANALKVLIDHHPHPEPFAKYIISETKVSSTSELLYNLITTIKGKINKEIAACLFTGIMTDTGGFSHNSSHPGTYEIIANLLKTGIDKNDIFDKIYNNFSADRMRLMGYCLNKKMQVYPEFKTAFISLSKKELEDFNFKTGDTEGFVNLPLSIKGIKISALFIEKDDMIKTSFRSKGSFPVNLLSGKYFNGGGHRNAAGGEYYDTMEKTLKKFIEILPEFKEDIDKA